MSLTYRTTDGDKWGSGKGARLTSSEVDNNFWSVLMRVVALEENPPAPIEIADIVLDGATFTVVMSDASELGPYPLPVTSFRWTGEYDPGFAYKVFDVFSVEGQDGGVYLVLTAHTAATEFDPDETDDSSDPLYHLMFGHTTIYDLGFYRNGPLPDSDLTEDQEEPLFQMVAVRDFYLPEGTGATVGRAFLRVPDDRDVVLPIMVAAANIGSISFDPSAQTGTVTIDDTTVVPAGTVLSVMPPDFATEGLVGADLSVTFRAVRGQPE